jgi:hypothetical protein
VKVQLCIPRAPVTTNDGRVVRSSAVYRFALRWTDHHPSAHRGIGVLLDQRNEVFDAHQFRAFRDAMGAWLESDDIERAAAAVGLSPGAVGRQAE